MRVVYQSDNGLTVEIGGQSVYRLKTRLQDGVSSAAHTVKPALSDGAITESLVLDQRIISIDGIFTVSHISQFMSRQNMLFEAFNPKFMGTLYCYHEDEARQIRCRATATPDVSSQTERSCNFRIDLISDDAYWESAELYHKSIGILENLLTFLRSVSAEGSPYSRISYIGLIDNITPLNAPPIIEVFSETDTFVKVENETTGEYFIIDRPIGQNQKMVIDVKRKTAGIWELQDGAYVFIGNVLNYLTTDSILWELVPGINIVRISTGNPEDETQAVISYRLKYGGV